MTNFGLSHYSIRSARFSKGFRAETVSAPFHPQRHAGTVPFKSRRPDTRGRSHPAGSHGAGTRANVISFPLPSGSLPHPSGATLERGQFAQAAIDVLAVGAAILFVGVTAVSISIALFLIFFAAW